MFLQLLWHKVIASYFREIWNLKSDLKLHNRINLKEDEEHVRTPPWLRGRPLCIGDNLSQDVILIVTHRS